MKERGLLAHIAPFFGVRYDEDKAGPLRQTVAPPYDVISPEQLADLQQRSDKNVIHIDLPNAEGEQTEQPYVEAGAKFREWIASGVLQVEEEASLYAYHQRYRVPGTDVVRDLTGFIAAVKLARWDEGIVLPHEHTFAKPKEDRLRLMEATKANFSQVYSFYSDPQMKAEGALSQAMASKRPAMSVQDDDGAEHNVWVVDDKDIIARVVEALREQRLYIADGHHRYETALDYRDALRQAGVTAEQGGHEYVMMMIVNAEGGGLTVLPTHRMISLADAPSRDEIRERLATWFSIEVMEVDEVQPTADKAWQRIADDPAGMVLVWPDTTWVLTLRDRKQAAAAIEDEASDAWKLLGVTVLHRLVLEKAAGLERQIQHDGEHIIYTRDAAEAVAAVLGGKCDVAAIVNAPSPQVIMEVADAGDAMPQKSTYFYPKLLTGLVFNDLTRPVG